MSIKHRLQHLGAEALNLGGWSTDGQPLPRECCVPSCTRRAAYGKVRHWWCREHWLIVVKAKAEDV